MKAHCTLRLVPLCLIAAGRVAIGHAETHEWTPASASPGLIMRFKELERSRTGPSLTVRYSIETSGFPKGKAFSLWMESLANPRRVVIEGFGADKNGRIVCRQDSRRPSAPRRGTPMRCDSNLDGYVWDVSTLLRGEWQKYALVSDGDDFSAYAELVPFPIEAHDGPCRLRAVLLTRDVLHLRIDGEGFPAEDKLVAVSQSESENLRSSVTTSKQGSFIMLLSPGVLGLRGGTAAFTVEGGSCRPTLTFQWGIDALHRPPERR